MTVEFPDADALRTASDVSLDDYPHFATARRHRVLEPIEDVAAAARDAVDALPVDNLPRGAEVAVTAGSRGIGDMPAVTAAVVEDLKYRGLEPFVLPAMGSHGGATAEGQRETLEALGFTETAMGCEIRSSMAVRAVGEDAMGRSVYVAEDALAADAVVLANRVKPHTDFSGPVESGLCKMAVVGLGKHRGAESLHNAGLAADFDEVITDRTRVVLEAADVVGGIALVEDARERATVIEGIPAGAILDREPDLLERAYEELPTLPVDDLDLLIVDELGKDISGTGMDTNVLGRYRFYGEREPETPEITRVYVRSVTDASHGNALGVGLADFARRDLVEAIDFEDTYVNIATSGEPERSKIPFVVPDDRTALTVIPSTLGLADLSEVRAAQIPNTLDPDDLVVSEPVARELEDRGDVTVGPLEPLAVEDGRLPPAPCPDS
jgi:hypothetical protein